MFAQISPTPDPGLVSYLQIISQFGAMGLLGYLAYLAPSMVRQLTDFHAKERELDREARRDDRADIVGAINNQTSSLTNSIKGVCVYRPHHQPPTAG